MLRLFVNRGIAVDDGGRDRRGVPDRERAQRVVGLRAERGVHHEQVGLAARPRSRRSRGHAARRRSRSRRPPPPPGRPRRARRPTTSPGACRAAATPEPAGLSVPITSRSELAARRHERGDLTGGLDVAVVDDLDPRRSLIQDPLDVIERQRRRPAVDVPGHVGPDRTTKSAPMIPLPGIEAPPVWTITLIPHACAQRVISAATSGSFTPEMPISPTSVTPAAAISCEVGLGQPRLEQHRAGMDLHARGAKVREGRVREDRERLHAGRVGRPTGRVRLARRDHRRRAAVQVRIDEAELALPRREVADHRMDVVVAEARRHGRPGGVDHGRMPMRPRRPRHRRTRSGRRGRRSCRPRRSGRRRRRSRSCRCCG